MYACVDSLTLIYIHNTYWSMLYPLTPPHTHTLYQEFALFIQTWISNLEREREWGNTTQSCFANLCCSHTHTKGSKASKLGRHNRHHSDGRPFPRVSFATTANDWPLFDQSFILPTCYVPHSFSLRFCGTQSQCVCTYCAYCLCVCVCVCVEPMFFTLNCSPFSILN